MKKIFCLLLLGMFLISFASAFDFDNSISYINNDKEVGITNLFGFGQHYADLKITSHEDLDKPIYANSGDYVLIQEINGKGDYNKFIKEPIFKNMKTGEIEDLDYHWEIITYSDVIANKDLYICEDKIGINGSFYQDCSRKVSKDETITKIVNRKEIDNYDIKAGETIYLGLVVEYIPPMSTYDVIPKFFGKEINKWAEFTNIVEDEHTFPLASASAANEGYGMKVYMRYNKTLINVTKGTGVTGGTCYIYDGTGTYISGSNVNFVGNTADYSSLYINLTQFNYYYFIVDNANDTGWQNYRDLGQIYPQNDTNLDWINGYTNNGVPESNHIVLQSEIANTIKSITTGDIGNLWTINVTYPFGNFNTTSYDLNYTFINISNTDSCWYSTDEGATNSTRVDCGTNWTGLTGVQGTNNNYVCGNLTDGTINCDNQTFFIDSIIPFVDIEYPLNSSIFTTTDIDINITMIDTNLQTCWWSNDTGTTNNTFTCGTNLTTQIWEQGSNTIYTYANDTIGNWNYTTIVFSIDSIEPYINITYPANASSFTSGDIDVNVTMTDTNLQTCWWSNNSGQTNYTFACGTNLTTNIWEFTNVVYMTANDSFGNENSSIISFTWLPFNETNQTFEPIITETNLSNFRINITSTTGYNIQSAILNYNGTNYTGAVTTQVSGNNYTIMKSINIIPRNVSFTNDKRELYWIITLVNEDSGVTSKFESEHYNQTVKELFFEECGINANITILNFTLKDQYDNSIINSSANATSFQTSFNFGLDSSYRVKNYSISNLTVDKSEYAFCTNETTNKIYTDMEAYYTAVDFSESNYYLSNSTLTNSTSHIDLFLLRESDSLEFFITAEQDLEPITYATVNVQKFFVGEGIYKSVEIDETDSSGEFTSYLDLDATYRFTIIRDGQVLGQVEKKAICQAAPCTLTLSLLSDSINVLEGYENSFAQEVIYNLSYNHTSNLVTFDFVDVTGTATYFRLIIYETTGNQSSTSIYDKKLYTSAGQILWDSSNYSTGDFRAETYISRSPDKFIDFITFVLSETAEELGIVGLFTAFLLLLIIIFGISFKPSMFIMTVPLSITLFKILGVAYLSNTFVIVIYILAIALTALLSK